MFYLTRLLVELLAPLNFSLLLLIVALLLLLLRRSKSAAICLGAALCIQLFCGYGFFVKEEIGKRENLFPAMTRERIAALDALQIQYIVVLGSGHVSDKRLPETSQIGGASLYRLTEGIRLLNIFPGTKLIVTGGVGHDPVPNAQVVGQVAESLGVPGERIIREERPRDTVQEAEILQPVLGKETFILVTSALHMPRAIEIFKFLGMQPIAAPTDYIVKHHEVEPPGTIFPSTANFDLSRRIIYEWIGSIWSKIKIALTDSR